jgi:MFS family permease
MKYLGVNKIIGFLLLFLFVINVSEGLFGPLLAVYITKNIVGTSLSTVGFAIAIYSIVKSIAQLPLAKRIDRKVGEKDDFYIMLTGAIIGIVCTFGYLFIKTPLHFYILSAISGLGGACLMAAYYGIFSHHVDRNSQGYEWSLLSVGGLTVSTAVGAAVGGIYTDMFGFSTTFMTAGMLSIIATLILLSLYPHLDGTLKEVRLTESKA